MGTGETFAGGNMGTIKVEGGDRSLSGEGFKSAIVHKFKKEVDITP